MSTSIAALNDFVGHHHRSSSRKVGPHNLFGSAAVACLVLGCAWTVYANVFGASVYPSLGGADYDLPAVKQRPAVAINGAAAAVGKTRTARLESAPRISAPATEPPGPALMFDERFAAASPQGVEPARQAEAPKLAEASKQKEIAPVQVALSAPAPLSHPVEAKPKGPAASVRDMAQRAKAAVMSIASAGKPTIVEKLWGRPQSSQPHGSLLSYASADASFTGSLGLDQNSATLGATPRYERDTAVYDISAHMVYLPDGSRLEAHSGLGSRLDDPRYVSARMVGPTPPHLYDLTLRESLFHGVPALRLNPVGGEETIFGRSGLLAHTYMLGPNGDSNGCVSFRDYNAFLNAYRNEGIKRLAVVARVD
jgi:hypothetical protein